MAKKIAVVGAGSAGVLAAYQVYKEFGDKVEITVFERQPHAGGRAWDVNFAGTRIEVGGTLLHSSGRHTTELMALTGGKEGTSGLSIDGKEENYAFWTKDGFVIDTKTTLVSMAMGIVGRVGVSSALKVTKLAKGMEEKWSGVYALEDEGKTFATPDELIETLGLREGTLVSLGEYLTEQKVNKRMQEEVVEAIVHNMYNQGLELNAFAGLVGLAGAGLAGGYLYSIEGGNWTLFENTLKAIKADYRPNTQVVSIEAKGEEGKKKFTIKTVVGTNDTFDAVVLASPLALADIEISIDGVPADFPKHPYQEVQTTLVVGTPNLDYFTNKKPNRLPSTVFTADSAGAPFKSIGVTGYSPEYDCRIYKIFSADHVMTDGELAEIFTEVKDKMTFVWRGAYPVLSPGIEHLPFELSPGLFYACAFETTAGAIEVEAVAGANTGRLVNAYLKTV
ncbi:MAG: FAD-dependent oxidoreductase [Eggerthellaceae bacterium]|nr:FAD-dependent oxidoreductase [Eggerthellaceae bacterium]